MKQEIRLTKNYLGKLRKVYLEQGIWPAIKKDLAVTIEDISVSLRMLCEGLEVEETREKCLYANLNHWDRNNKNWCYWEYTAAEERLKNLHLERRRLFS